MIDYSEVDVERALNLTSIDLGEYVINPYKGCAYGCLYCYVRSNKTSLRSARLWGSYVEIRANIINLLEEELIAQKPTCVLLGSTTECFQPVEQKYGLTKRILEVLNKYKVSYVILTRSPLIQDCISLLQSGFCKKVYFSVNDFSPELKIALEPKSPSFESRFQAIKELSKHGIEVVPYVCPVLPAITDVARIFDLYSGMKVIDFEGLNFNLKNIQDIVDAINLFYPHLKENYLKMLVDDAFYEKIWKDMQTEILTRSREHNKDCHVFIHPFGEYFKNSYLV
ncbi:MAG: radical SAM protein [Candidatus Omnitrophota bacterium]